ncbi:MAG TPA: hypothetical protein VNE63_12940 [Candidatus Acidoferrales bacterium]|nr:hypothetical protein [Candidatus Acidoferrales bacterium]
MNREWTFAGRAMAVLTFLLLSTAAWVPAARAADPCCNITGINARTGEVSARENATGRTFTFKVSDARLLKSLKVGEGVYANFSRKQVSIDGRRACCAIMAQPTDGLRALPPDGLRAVPCCAVSAVNRKTSEVTVRMASTGQFITVKVLALTAAQLARTFKIGSRVDALPPGGARLTLGLHIKLTPVGFQPIDSIVSRIAAQ